MELTRKGCVETSPCENALIYERKAQSEVKTPGDISSYRATEVIVGQSQNTSSCILVPSSSCVCTRVV